ncbi:hypothetical protein RGQ29_016202 [Quercus rubra]|uniref:PGG domain-containing protein n=1 Tax=Quercus rubra TaxID=3512 RepID=A0AAN7IZC5_QUERU|nr:hypothetical protein RGQ29_016202 [Quercus rubra]
MDAKIERLKQVAQSGDIDAFYTLIREDVQLLEHIDELPFADTPLHIAAFTGQIPFAVETMGLKPSFAWKLDPNGFRRERLTSLHYVVESGEHAHLNLLDEFLLLCPDSIIDVTMRNETVLHIALKFNRLEAFKFFTGWLANNSSENAEFNKRTVLNWQDNEGNTVLHILAVRHFLSWANRFMDVNDRRKRLLDVNSKNLEDKTAWDMLQEGNREIRVMLLCAGAKPGSSLSTFNRKLTEERRNMFLVVAVLLATLTYQAILTPPGGVWQDNEMPMNKHRTNTTNHNNKQSFSQTSLNSSIIRSP